MAPLRLGCAAKHSTMNSGGRAQELLQLTFYYLRSTSISLGLFSKPLATRYPVLLVNRSPAGNALHLIQFPGQLS